MEIGNTVTAASSFVASGNRFSIENFPSFPSSIFGLILGAFSFWFRGWNLNDVLDDEVGINMEGRGKSGSHGGTLADIWKLTEKLKV